MYLFDCTLVGIVNTILVVRLAIRTLVGSLVNRTSVGMLIAVFYAGLCYSTSVINLAMKGFLVPCVITDYIVRCDFYACNFYFHYFIVRFEVL